MYCIHCGTQNPDDYNFCMKCGKQRADTATASPSDPDDLLGQAIQEATSTILGKDQNKLQPLIAKALKSPDTTLEEVQAEFKYALETRVDNDTAKKAQTILKILRENDKNSVAYIFRHGTFAPYETAFTIEDFFRRSHWARTLPDGQRGSNLPIIKQDYSTYIRLGISGLLPRCTTVDHDALNKMLGYQGIMTWLEYELVKGMLLSLSLDRRKVVSDDTATLNARLGPELTNDIMDYLTTLLSVAR